MPPLFQHPQDFDRNKPINLKVRHLGDQLSIQNVYKKEISQNRHKRVKDRDVNRLSVFYERIAKSAQERGCTKTLSTRG